VSPDAGCRLSRTLDGVDWVALKADLNTDDFDNGRSAGQLRASFAASGLIVLAWAADRLIGTARALTDGVCNAYLIDVWTATPYRRRGAGTAMVRDLLQRLPGQHVALFTSDHRAFYESLGFASEYDGMSQVVGRWLSGAPDAVRTA